VPSPDRLGFYLLSRNDRRSADFGKLEGGDLFVENKKPQRSGPGRDDMAPIVSEADIRQGAIVTTGEAAPLGAGSDDNYGQFHAAAPASGNRVVGHCGYGDDNLRNGRRLEARITAGAQTSEAAMPTRKLRRTIMGSLLGCRMAASPFGNHLAEAGRLAGVKAPFSMRR
jgi:hypothetical protein